MIQTKTEISIDALGRWFYRDAEITQPDVLKYFKQNLYRSDRYYILNIFGDLREEGDLDRVLACPVLAISATFKDNSFEFYLDSEERLTVLQSEIHLSGMDCLFFVHPRGFPVRLKTSAMGHVSEYLTGSEDAPVWKNGETLIRSQIDGLLQP
ncbi:MAG: hypothetical protein K8S54_14250 [Spirochaetia bacterium]|nr:hypothetical protein [Spirochaetia bacterium]